MHHRFGQHWHASSIRATLACIINSGNTGMHNLFGQHCQQPQRRLCCSTRSAGCQRACSRACCGVCHCWRPRGLGKAVGASARGLLAAAEGGAGCCRRWRPHLQRICRRRWRQRKRRHTQPTGAAAVGVPRRRQASDLHDGDVGEQHLTGSMRQSVSQLQKSFDVQFVSTGLTTRSSHTAEKQALYYFTRG